MAVKLTLEQIRDLATDQSFSRGEEYYSSGAIFDMVQRGDEIEGFCQGSSQPNPYYIEVKFNAAGIAETSCSCPYDFEGECKHVVALLLTYLRTPESFEVRQPVKNLLQQRSKEELITLIDQMVDRYPDLQRLLDLPLPTPSKRQSTVDTKGFRKEIRRALRSYEGWGDATAQFAIRSVARAAEVFATQNDWRNASAIYRAIIEECTADDEYEMPDDEGEFTDSVNDVLEHLAALLDQLDVVGDDNERRAILKSLLQAYIWDRELGGYGLGDEVPGYLLRYAQQSDIPFIRQQLDDVQGDSAALPDNDFHAQYSAKAYATLIVRLEALYEPNPEVILTQLREHGLYSLLVAKLLELDRSNEAVEVVEKQMVNPWERLAELPHLVAHGRSDDAIRLACEMLKAGYDERVAQWLLEQYQVRGDAEASFDLQRQRMFAQPSEPVYASLKAAAQAVQRWSETRQQMIENFQNEKRYNVLIMIYLHDSEWDAAWDTLEKQASSKPELRTPWMQNGLDLEVAQRSQEARPQKAIPVFIKYARVEINNRDRKHYQAAARLLAVIRKLYRQTDNEDAWKQLIAGIRAEFPSLRALQEELTKAGL